jgi:type IV pilus assembly protein PilC
VSTILLTFVLPKTAALFEELDAPLPFLTRTILAIGAFLADQFMLITLGFFLFLVALALFARTRRGKYALHYAVLRMPVFGTLIREYNISLFFRALDSLFTSGTPLVQALEIARKTPNNQVYRDELGRFQSIIEHGVPLSDLLKAHPFLFPPQAQRIVEIGEQSGTLQMNCRRISEHYERSVYRQAAMINTLLEPVLMIIVGIAVGGLALSIFLPLYQVTSLF